MVQQIHNPNLTKLYNTQQMITVIKSNSYAFISFVVYGVFWCF